MFSFPLGTIYQGAREELNLPSFDKSSEEPLHPLSVCDCWAGAPGFVGDLLYPRMGREASQRLNKSLTGETLNRQIDLPPPSTTILFTRKREENKERRKFVLGEVSKYLAGETGKHVLAYSGIYRDYPFSLADVNCRCPLSVPAYLLPTKKSAAESHPLRHRHMSKAVSQERPPRTFPGNFGVDT